MYLFVMDYRVGQVFRYSVSDSCTTEDAENLIRTHHNLADCYYMITEDSTVRYE